MMLASLLVLATALQLDPLSVEGVSGRVCMQQESVDFQVANATAERLFVAIGVEHWALHTSTDKWQWCVVHSDVFVPTALRKVSSAMHISPGQTLMVSWSLKDRQGPPELRVGRYRVQATIFRFPDQSRVSQVLFEFQLVQCTP
jgi:hypothetical protein